MSDFDFSALKTAPAELDPRKTAGRPRKDADPQFIAWLKQSWEGETALKVTVPSAQLYAFVANLRRATEEFEGMGVSIQPSFTGKELAAMREAGGNGKTEVKFQAKPRKQRKTDSAA